MTDGIRDFFKNKKITLMGLGLLGRGVGDAAFLAEAGASLTVTDLKSEEELASSLERLKKYKNIKFRLGRHDLDDFKSVDLVIKAAGVPLDSPYIIEAEKNNVPITMSTALFVELTEAEIIGVTGTRGKSTVSHLIYEILRENNSSGKVYLGGNIVGMSTLELLNVVKKGDKVVLELDSWQLQGFAGTHDRNLPEKIEGFSPSIAVFTTFMPDHLNYYDQSMERYFADKANIYRFQNETDELIISEEVAGYIKKFGPKPKSNITVAEASQVPEDWKIKIPGEHNKLNVALARATAKRMGVSDAVIKKAVEKFKSIPGRLELVRTIDGVDIYNDTNSTTEEATIAGLKAFGSDKKTILIFGGADKKLGSKKLISALPEYAKALVVLPGTGTDKIKAELDSLRETLPMIFVVSMKEAVGEAWGLAEKGDRILLSPGFASFGLFKNEYDRGDQFNECVKKLNE